MIDLNTFIDQCGKDLVHNRRISEHSLLLFENLSNKDKNLCSPILELIAQKPIFGTSDICVHTPEERIKVCKLIPLLFSLDTDAPAWSSYMLHQSIKAALAVNNISLAEVGIAVMEVLGEFLTPLNSFVYNFCIDLAKELNINWHNRNNELEALNFWNMNNQLLPSVAFCKYVLTPSDKYEPQFILETMVALLNNDFLNDLVAETKYLFDNAAYKQNFLNYLQSSELSAPNKELIRDMFFI